MEVWERRYPVRFQRYEFVEDSGGAGTWRGGLGTTRHLELTLPTVLTAIADRHVLPPTGSFGGGPGLHNRFSIIREGRDRTIKDWFNIPSPSKFANLPTRVGDVLTVTQGGGGGYGDPLKRDPLLVSADVLNGYVSAERARADYGVVFESNTLRVDAAATERERRARAGESRSR
jgi:N-methylhydantoinase B/oxoprolinase/acetone carboxylase alpha subunit